MGRSAGVRKVTFAKKRMASWITHLRKMKTTLADGAMYELPLVNILEHTGKEPCNEWVGKRMNIRFLNEIHCVITGKKIKKTYGEGMSFDAWQSSPLAVESIIRPELSRIHEGIALRDFDWEQEHHNQPHYLYLSRTSDVKVGVTRTTNVPSRWIDQGASEAIVVAITPYRQLAGLMEVVLKEHMTDKTNWQAMLKNTVNDTTPLVVKKEAVLDMLGEQYEAFFSDDDSVHSIQYPVLEYPQKIKSLKLDSVPEFNGRLVGIKGQYWLFDDGAVFNVRSHAGYRIQIDVADDE
jgi:hypothetical protein